MSARVIDGQEIAQRFRLRIAKCTAEYIQKGITPCLAVVLVGDNPASLSYVAAKEKALKEAGMEDRCIRLPSLVSEDELLRVIDSLNADCSVHGILVQLPLPAHINSDRIIYAINPDKDVDGFHPLNAGKLLTGQDCFVPCTPLGVVRLLKEAGIATDGAHAVIIGRSHIVGKPLASLLSRKEINATVTLCHSGTRDLPFFTRSADILIACVGKPCFISADMIKPGAAVIDVGVNRIADSGKKSGFRLAGDVDFEHALTTAGAITPVPKGVGPMTIAMLLHNTLAAAQKACGATPVPFC